ncbi:MAG: YfhO family protein, partial [Candidatus Hydrogenedentes bacterium]|nr:YfhO family protein [Candidatus Hydrogenedentota bacterium]
VSPERVIVRVDAPQPGITILSDTLAPGWKATLGGAPSPILKANGVFRGIATPAGRHEIVFYYRPWSVIAGAGIALTLAALLAGTGLAALARRD